jgi:hypothetical protein
VLAGILEQSEQRQEQQDNDDPQGEISQIGVHRVSLPGDPPEPRRLALVAANRGGFTSRSTGM